MTFATESRTQQRSRKAARAEELKTETLTAVCALCDGGVNRVAFQGEAFTVLARMQCHRDEVHPEVKTAKRAVSATARERRPSSEVQKRREENARAAVPVILDFCKTPATKQAIRNAVIAAGLQGTSAAHAFERLRDEGKLHEVPGRYKGRPLWEAVE